MKRYWICAVALVCLATFARAEQKSKAVVVKLVDYDRTVTFQSMSTEDWKKLEEELKLEAKVFPAALELARKEWEKDEQYRRKQFPKSQMSCREASASSPMDEDKASDMVAKKQEHMAKQAEDEAKKAAEKAKQKNKTPSDSEKKAEADRKRLVSSALDMVRSKVEQLKASKATTDAAGAAKPAGT